jgi:hypothetical protein
MLWQRRPLRDPLQRRVALVHIRDEAQDEPSPETLCDNV